MNNDIDHPRSPRNTKMLAGLVLLAVGCALLFKQLNYFFLPGWLFDWPMLLIVIGLYQGAKHEFRNPGSYLMIVLGLLLLANDAIPDFDFWNYTVPILIIVFGIWMILKRNHRWDKNTFHLKSRKWQDKYDWKQYASTQPGEAAADMPGIPPSPHTFGDDWLDTVSIFGGVKKTILSKDFKGGEIVNIFGGAELDFTQADIRGKVVLDITQIFGGTKIIVPSNWQVVSDVAAVFASVDDKRIRTVPLTDDGKILVLKGASIFAGVDVRSF